MNQGSDEIETPRSFPTWRTVRRGVYKTLDAYLADMKAKGYGISEYAAEILPLVVWSREEGEEELVMVLDQNLGIADSYTPDKLFAAAARFGLYRLDADVAAGLREQYDDQPVGEWCLAAMDQIGSCFRSLRVFEIARFDARALLDAHNAFPEVRFGFGIVWIFSRRKPTSAT